MVEELAVRGEGDEDGGDGGGERDEDRWTKIVTDQAPEGLLIAVGFITIAITYLITLQNKSTGYLSIDRTNPSIHPSIIKSTQTSQQTCS